MWCVILGHIPMISQCTSQQSQPEYSSQSRDWQTLFSDNLINISENWRWPSSSDITDIENWIPSFLPWWENQTHWGLESHHPYIIDVSCGWNAHTRLVCWHHHFTIYWHFHNMEGIQKSRLEIYIWEPVTHRCTPSYDTGDVIKGVSVD